MGKADSTTPLLSTNTGSNKVQTHQPQQTETGLDRPGPEESTRSNHNSYAAISTPEIADEQFREMEESFALSKKRSRVYAYLRTVLIFFLTICFLLPIGCMIFSVPLMRAVDNKYGDNYLQTFVENSTNIDVQDIDWRILNSQHIQLNVTADVSFDYLSSVNDASFTATSSSLGLLPSDKTLRKLMRFSMNHAVRNMCIMVDNIEVVGEVHKDNEKSYHSDSVKWSLSNLKPGSQDELLCFSVMENVTTRVYVPILLELNWTNLYKIIKVINSEKDREALQRNIEIFSVLDLNVYKETFLGHKLPILKNLHIDKFDVTKYILDTGYYTEFAEPYLRPSSSGIGEE
ncbi:hypothetical protein ACO0QE_003940 [Hanseniaspora vineae]